MEEAFGFARTPISVSVNKHLKAKQLSKRSNGIERSPYEREHAKKPFLKAVGLEGPPLCKAPVTAVHPVLYDIFAPPTAITSDQQLLPDIVGSQRGYENRRLPFNVSLGGDGSVRENVGRIR